MVLCFNADVPLSVEIVEDESGRKSLFAEGIAEYAYTSNGGLASSRARVNIGLLENDYINIYASYECNFPKRMKLPCLHELTLSLTIDRDQEKFAQAQKIGNFDNLISAFLRCLVMKR